jgi:hypothetical protein
MEGLDVILKSMFKHYVGRAWIHAFDSLNGSAAASYGSDDELRSSKRGRELPDYL